MIDLLEVKKERLQEVRIQLKKYFRGQYNCAAVNMLKAEQDKLKAEIKEIEARREEKLACKECWQEIEDYLKFKGSV